MRSGWFLVWSSAGLATALDYPAIDGFGKLRGGKHEGAKAFNVSEPVYTCPKPGYVLVNEECIFEDSVPARFECPIGYTPIGDRAAPIDCVRTAPPVLSCPSTSVLKNGECVECALTEPQIVCPTDATLVGELCIRLDPIAPVETCPEGSTRVGAACVAVDYQDPRFVCPPDTIQEGKKCRRETLVIKSKKEVTFAPKRKLEESYDDLPEYYPEFDDIPARVFEGEVVGSDVEGECVGCAATWLPAVGKQAARPNGDKQADREARQAEKEARAQAREEARAEKDAAKAGNGGGKTGTGGGVIGGGKVSKAKPTAAPTTTAEAPRTPKGKTRVEVVRAPSQIVKVQTYPAEKVCDVGERYGGVCVVQTAVPPVTECPVPRIDGQCVQRVVVPPVTSCPAPADEPAELVCPPRIGGKQCKCERCQSFPPVRTCPGGILRPEGTCRYTATPKPYCPIGYFIEDVTCKRRDVEAALCLFNVTYTCGDCDVSKLTAPKF